MRVNYAILDLETTIRNKDIGSNPASPFFPDNHVVIGKYKMYDEYGRFEERYTARPNFMTEKHLIALFEGADILVGHNIKFDLLHIRKDYNSLYNEWVKKGGMVWDTQVVEYLLSGQSHLYPSLDQCAEKYGGTLKDDKIKEYWKNGIDTVDIPVDELREYLDGDIDNTEIVFNRQWEEVDRLGILPLVMTQMRALMALVEIEYNGLYFDVDGASQKCETLEERLAILENNLTETMERFLPTNMAVSVKPSSPQQLSAVLFGDKVKTILNVPILGPDGLPLEFKSGKNKGKIRTKKVIETIEKRGMSMKPIGGRGKAGYYSTDDETLNKLLSQAIKDGNTVASVFIADLLTYRTLSKDISTYYKGYSKLVFPDGFIHPNFNQCATATGRLSSNNPNAQNLSKEDS